MSEKPHLACPYSPCNSSDAFSFNDSKGVGKCHSCGNGYPMSKSKMKKEGITLHAWAKEVYPIAELKEARNLKLVEAGKGTFEGIRGLKPETCRLYGIQMQYDTEGNPLRYAFKHRNNVKYRSHEDLADEIPGDKSKMYWAKLRGDQGGDFDWLFGPEFNAGTSKRIYLTEGEFDAASLYEILDGRYPVMSLPSATPSKHFWPNVKDYLDEFSEIIYAGELDKAGKACADKVYSQFPTKTKYVSMTEFKDANEFLLNGAEEDLKWAALKPQMYTPDNFFIGDAAVEKAILEENPYSYVPTGHIGFDKLCRGLVKGGITFIKALRGTGKTELIRFFEYGLLKNSTANIALLHMEEPKSLTYRAMASYELGINVRTKEDAAERNVTEKQVIDAAKTVLQNDRTIVFEMRASDEPDAILEYVRTAATTYGAEYVFVDHVQRLAYLSKAGVEQATAVLTKLGANMAQLAKELDIGVIFISQVNDDGRTKYAAALEEEAIVCVKLERNTDSDDEDERNTTYFDVDKNRPFSKLGNAGSVFYDGETTILSEVKEYAPDV